MSKNKFKLNAACLGRRLEINSHAMAIKIPAGYCVRYMDDVVEVIIGIGNNHTASLIMNKYAWEELKSGEEIHINNYECSSDNDNL